MISPGAFLSLAKPLIGNYAYDATYLCRFCCIGGNHDCAAAPRDTPRCACKLSGALRLLDRNRGRVIVSLTCRGRPRPAYDIGIGRGRQLRGALFVCIPSSEQKSAPRLGALLLNIGQIDGVSFHQKLDCRHNDQEWRNVNREYLKGVHGSSSAISGRYRNLLGRSGFSTALMPSSARGSAPF
jgi:hypothetical protein